MVALLRRLQMIFNPITKAKELIYKKNKNVEEALDDLSVSIAPEFESGKTYYIGDYCTYNGKLYSCLGNVKATRFDEAYWKEISIADVTGSLQSSLAKPYEAGKQYVVGDYCTHNGRLYCCNTSSKISNFFNSYWDEVCITDDLTTLEIKTIRIQGQTHEGGFIRIENMINPKCILMIRNNAAGYYALPMKYVDECYYAICISNDTEVYYKKYVGAVDLTVFYI